MTYADAVTVSNGARGIQRRTLVVVAAALAAVVVAIGAWWVASAGDTDRTAQHTTATPAATAEATPEASATASGEPAEPAAPEAAEEPPAEDVPVTVVNGVPLPEENVAAPVTFEEPAEIAPSFNAAVREIRAIDGVGQGIGEISGPALAFTVTLTNNTGAALETFGVVVNAYDSTAAPAIPLLGDPNAKQLPGSIAPGGTATGTYVFRIPPEARDTVTLTVAFDPESPVVVFSGPIR